MEKDNSEEKEIQETPKNEVKEQDLEGVSGESPENDQDKVGDNEAEEADKKNDLEVLQDELAESKDKYLRLYSEFENFRRRTAKEKLEMVQTANESLISDLLPVIDDFERAEKSFDDNDSDVKALKEGLDLISTKFKKVLE
ncbi:MAG: nucleotide exchange factor GrpE, partial [Bacteroidota bacterium]